MAEQGTGSGWEAGGLIGGILGSVGSGLGWGAASWQKDTASAASSKAWRRMMFADNTAMVRRVQDLKNAGLNPILAAGGSGAGSPSIGASMVPGVDTDISGAVGRGISAAKEARLQSTVLARAQADQKAAEANAAAAEVDAANKREFGRENAVYDRNARLEAWRNAVGTGLLLEAQKAAANAQSGKTNVDAALGRAALTEEEARARWVRDNPTLYDIEQASRALEPAISGAAKAFDRTAVGKVVRRGRR